MPSRSARARPCPADRAAVPAGTRRCLWVSDIPVASDPDAVLEHIEPGAGLKVPLAKSEPVALLMPSTRTETHLQVRGPARPGDVVTTFKNTVDKVVTEWPSPTHAVARCVNASRR